MEQLLKITTVPISVELKINDARLELNSASAELKITRDKGGLHMKSSPVRLNIDTFEARNSVVPTTARSITQNAQKGQQRAYDVGSKHSQEARMFREAQIGEDVITRIAAQSVAQSSDFKLDFLPKAGPNITYQAPDLSIQYEMDKLNFDWRIGGLNLEFVPGSVELVVKQRPDVIIEYVGEPIYVPPSANPNYDAKA